jgi:hypothetical protein
MYLKVVSCGHFVAITSGISSFYSSEIHNYAQLEAELGKLLLKIHNNTHTFTSLTFHFQEVNVLLLVDTLD